MLTLYDFGNSVCCQKVRIVLRAKGLEWQAKEVKLFKAEQYDPEYLKLNPKGVVPTLVHNGHAIPESTLICEYLNDTFPEPPLMPEDPYLRTRARTWSKMVDEGVFEATTEISFSAMFRERMRTMPEEVRQTRFRNIGDPRRRDRFESTYELGTRSPFVRHGVFAFERAFKMMEATLEEGGPWLVGEEATLADIAMMPYVARLDYLELLDLWAAERPYVQDWWMMVQQWPAFVTGLADLITPAEFVEMAVHGPKIADELAELVTEVRANVAEAARLMA